MENLFCGCVGRGNLIKKKKTKEILNRNYGSLMDLSFLHDLRFIKSQAKTNFVSSLYLIIQGNNGISNYRAI